MSIALQAILFLLGYLPGAIFLSSYFSALSSDPDLPVVSSTVSSRAAAALILAIMLNAVWGGVYSMASCGDSPCIDYRFLLTLFVGQAKDNEQFQNAVNWIATNRAVLVGYFISLCLCSWFAGHYTHTVVRRFRLDMVYPALRHASHWHYLLSAECLDFPERANERPRGIATSKEAICVATILTEIDKKPYLYYGQVQKFTLDKSGELETLILEFCVRTTFADMDKVPPADGIQIDAHFFVIRYSDIRNIALNYYNRRDIGLNQRAAAVTALDLAHAEDDEHD